jgi:DUF971 family protein
MIDAVHALRPRATEIRLKKAEKILEVDFSDGSTVSLGAEFLRVHSPSAEVQGHTPAERQIVAGRRHVGITEVAAVGNYAIRITFDDLHDSGLYSWDLLRGFGQNQETIWAAYLAELEENGLSRDP